MAATVLTIAQQKGGAGKTTLAAQLALAWARGGRKRVAVMDIDPQASLARWHKVREAATDIKAQIHVSDISGWRVNTELDRLRRLHDLVIIDSPPHAETEAKLAVRAARLVAIPVQPSPMDVWATQETLALAAAEKVPVLLVLNRVPPRGKVLDTIRAMLAEQNLPVAECMLGNRVAFATSMLEGKGVLETDPRGAAAREILALAGELGGRLGF